MEQTDEAMLYKSEWSQGVRDVVDEMVDHDAVILEATARDDRGNLRLRFADEAMVSEFQEYFRDRGRRFEVNQLSTPSESHVREFDLTEEQCDALVAAVRGGSFRVPRETTVEDLGATLGVSANAASQRLQRGSETLVRNALTIRDDETTGQ